VNHPHVPRPDLAVRHATPHLNNVVAKVASNVLGSMALFWVTFLIPLLTIPASESTKLIVSIVFSSWFQAWALPVLQNAANRADEQRQIKADADHMSLTYIATQVDLLVVQGNSLALRMSETPPKRKRDR
jgi:Co/Zn/Cd efflux system component